MNTLISNNTNLDEVRVMGSKTQYTYDCVYRKEDPSIIVKWCRRNFGERGKGWDFILNQGRVIIEIREDKYKVMYEMWKT
jgi:hypothetical protein